LPSVKSIIKGLSQRDASKEPAVYIHTSGYVIFSSSSLPPSFALSASKLTFGPRCIALLIFPQSTVRNSHFSSVIALSFSFLPFRTGVLTFPDHPDDILFNDKSPDKFDTLIPDEADHREIDLYIKQAVESKKLNAKISIVRFPFPLSISFPPYCS
jgi:hypothetical protein